MSYTFSWLNRLRQRIEPEDTPPLGWTADPYGTYAYNQGRSALYRAVGQGDTYPLLGIADHAYWYARWKELMKDKISDYSFWEDAMNPPCHACGQSVPVKVQPVFKAGDIVETRNGLAYVPNAWVIEAMVSQSFNITGRQWVISFAKGEALRLPVEELKVVHGYFHIVRENR